MARSSAVALAVLSTLLLAGCEAYDTPQQPLPDDFEVRLLADGSLMGPAELRGKPWVIQLWFPK